jgi:hypothetical protein
LLAGLGGIPSPKRILLLLQQVWNAGLFLEAAPDVLRVPAKIQGQVRAIACGVYHMLVILQDNSTVAWGDAANGKTTVPPETSQATMEVSAGEQHSLFRLKDGRVLKAGLLPGVSSKVVPLSRPARAIASGDNHAAIILSNGTLVMLGDSSRGQGSLPSAARIGAPVKLVTAAGHCTLALTANGLVAWGKPYCTDPSPKPTGTAFRALRAVVFYADEAQYIVNYAAQVRLHRVALDAGCT